MILLLGARLRLHPYFWDETVHPQSVIFPVDHHTLEEAGEARGWRSGATLIWLVNSSPPCPWWPCVFYAISHLALKRVNNHIMFYQTIQQMESAWVISYIAQRLRDRLRDLSFGSWSAICSPNKGCGRCCERVMASKINPSVLRPLLKYCECCNLTLSF